MRIAFVAETLGCPMYLGGISRYTWVLGNALIGLGHEVHVYTMATPDEYTHEFGKNCPIHFHHVRAYWPSTFGYRSIYHRIRERFPGYFFVNEWAIPLVARLMRDARRGLLDIVESPETGGRVAIGTKLLSQVIPVVGRLHSPSFITSQDYYAKDSAHLRELDQMEALFARSATAISAPSRAVADLVQERFGVHGDIRVVGNPVPLPKARLTDIRSAPEKRVAFVGRFEPLKGFDTLLRSLPMIVQKFPNVIIDLVGPDRINAFAHGIEAGLAGFMSADDAKRVAPAIRNHGQLSPEQADDVRALATCVVIPSTFESFSFTLTEAMALARPVVASRVAALAEIVDHGRSGLLFDVGSHEQLATQVNLLLADPEKAYAMGQAAREDIERRFVPNVVATQLADFYADVCHAAKSRR